MKFSLALSVLILAIGASLSWHHSQQLAVLRENRTKIAAEAATLGIPPDPSGRNDPLRTSKYERKNKAVTATAVLAEFVTFIKEMEAAGKSFESLDEADKGRIKEILGRFSSLDPAQLRAIATEVYAAKDLKDEGREMILRHALFQLAADHPQTALALFTQ